MSASFFFYDLETSGLSASTARVMQFAGQRTDSDLNPIGEPVNVFIKLTGDILPEPEAILLTGITPQQTLADGLTEAEFLEFFYKEVVQPETTFLGFNSVRFDDEFMRYLHYRNFYDPYEWQWTNNCSRWDVLDLVRMTRALRPEGIEWPFKEDGKPTNKLELLTKLNGLEHSQAHDALSDVYATINVTKLVKDKQPELFKYLFDCRNKKKVTELVTAGRPFIYTSGKYSAETLNTTAAVMLAENNKEGNAIVFDLRFDPTVYAGMTAEELAGEWRYKPGVVPNFPIKTLKFNRCPAIAPVGVMNKPEVEARLKLSVDAITANYNKLKSVHKVLAEKIFAAKVILDEERTSDQARQIKPTVDTRLYDGFMAEGDKPLMRSVREASPANLSIYALKLKDERLKELLPLYKARNYPRELSSDERAAWDAHCAEALFDGGADSRLAYYFGRLQALAKETGLSDNQRYLIEEMQLYGESIMPTDITD